MKLKKRWDEKGKTERAGQVSLILSGNKSGSKSRLW